MVKTAFQQLRHARALGERIGKLQAPGPWLARGGFVWLNHPRLTAIDLKNVPLIASPRIDLFARPREGFTGLDGCAQHDQDESETEAVPQERKIQGVADALLLSNGYHRAPS